MPASGANGGGGESHNPTLEARVLSADPHSSRDPTHILQAGSREPTPAARPDHQLPHGEDDDRVKHRAAAGFWGADAEAKKAAPAPPHSCGAAHPLPPRPPPPPPPPSYFHIRERGSTVATEVKAGVCTFMTMSYILLVNGQILGAAGLPVQSVVAATALSSCVASFLAGVLANVPFGVSPGMGLNAFLVFSQVLGLGATPESALAGCMVAAALVALLASCRALNLVLSLVPDAIKLATVVGMGLLLSFIGLQTAKVVVPDAETMVTLGNLSGSVEPALAAAGLALIASLHYRNVRGSIIAGILATALAYYCFLGGWPTKVVALPHLERVELDYSTLFGGGGGAVGGGGGGGKEGGAGVAAALAAVGSGQAWAAGAAALAATPRRMLMMMTTASALSSPGEGGGGGGQDDGDDGLSSPPSSSVAPLPLASAASRATAERVRVASPSAPSRPLLLLNGDSSLPTADGLSVSSSSSHPKHPPPHPKKKNMKRRPPPPPPPPPGSSPSSSSPSSPSSSPKPPPPPTPTQSTAWSAVCAYALVMVFDIGGAMFGLGSLAGLVRPRADGRGGELPGATWVFLSACLGTALGAAAGTTPLIIAAESAVGIKEGGRTGLVAVVISMCFAASCFLAPLLQAIPQVATAPVLVLVGAMMMGESVHIDWGSMPTAVPAFLTIVVQPFTFSIANGIYAGVLMSAALFLLTGGLWRSLVVAAGGGGGSGGDAGAASLDEAAAAAAANGNGEEDEEGGNERGLLGGGGGGGGGGGADGHRHSPQHPHHHHAPLPFEEPLLTNTYDGGGGGGAGGGAAAAHPHPHHHLDAPTPYKQPPPPPPSFLPGGANTTTTAPRPIAGAASSDAGSDRGGLPMAAGRGASSSITRRGGGGVGSGGGGGGAGGGGSAAAAVVGSFSRLASSLTRPNQYERASFTMLTNTAPMSAGGAAGSLSTSQQQQQQQREREQREQREQRDREQQR
jgi:xanthine/uracil/vitamin C permease (AzgA family)